MKVRFWGNVTTVELVVSSKNSVVCYNEFDGSNNVIFSQEKYDSRNQGLFSNQ